MTCKVHGEVTPKGAPIVDHHRACSVYVAGQRFVEYPDGKTYQFFNVCGEPLTGEYPTMQRGNTKDERID